MLWPTMRTLELDPSSAAAVSSAPISSRRPATVVEAVVLASSGVIRLALVMPTMAPGCTVSKALAMLAAVLDVEEEATELVAVEDETALLAAWLEEDGAGVLSPSLPPPQAAKITLSASAEAVSLKVFCLVMVSPEMREVRRSAWPWWRVRRMIVCRLMLGAGTADDVRVNSGRSRRFFGAREGFHGKLRNAVEAGGFVMQALELSGIFLLR